MRLLLTKLGINVNLYGNQGRRRLGEEDDEDDANVFSAGEQDNKKGPTEGGGPFCFPLAANEERYQPLLMDCKVSDQGSEDAGACCVQCSSTANCTGFSYISGGMPDPEAVLGRPRLPIQVLHPVP